MPRGKGRRCTGYLSNGGMYVYCSREEHAHTLPMEMTDPVTYKHYLGGKCNCGVAHGVSFVTESNGRAPISSTYDYVDETGELLFQVCRFGKRFRQRRPDPDKPGEFVWNLNGTRRVLYRLPLVLSAVKAGHPIYIPEGEKDVHALEDAGVVATTNPGGAGKWRDEYSATLRGADVVIVADKDKAGREHAEQVRASLEGVAKSVRIVEPSAGKDSYDHLAAGRNVSELIDSPRAEQSAMHASLAVGVSTLSTGKAKRTPTLVDLRDLTVRKVEWLVRDRIAVAMLTLLVGHGGVGKGIYWIGVAAKITRGEIGASKGVLISAPEDVYEEMLKPRLIAAGADLKYIRGIHGLVWPDDQGWLEENIETGIEGERVCLAVVDPVLTHLTSKTDSYRDHDVKLALTPLLDTAQRMRCGMLGVVHFTKSTERGAFLSIQASGAFGNTARHVLGMVDHSTDPDARVLGVVKTNISKKGLSWRLRVDTKNIPELPDPEDAVPFMVEDGDSTETVDDHLSARPSRAAVDPAKLRDLVSRELASGNKRREYLNKVASDELNASADTLYKNALLPMKEEGKLSVSKDGQSGGWYWGLTDGDSPF